MSFEGEGSADAPLDLLSTHSDLEREFSRICNTCFHIGGYCECVDTETINALHYTPINQSLNSENAESDGDDGQLIDTVSTPNIRHPCNVGKHDENRIS